LALKEVNVPTEFEERKYKSGYFNQVNWMYLTAFGHLIMGIIYESIRLIKYAFIKMQSDGVNPRAKAKLIIYSVLYGRQAIYRQLRKLWPL